VSGITCNPNPGTIDVLETCVVTGTALPTATGVLTLNTSQTAGSGQAACPAVWVEASTPAPSATAKSFTCTPTVQGTGLIRLNLQAQNNGSNAGSSVTLPVNSVYAVSTFAGSTAGNADGTGTAASFLRPDGVAFGKDGNIYVADSANSSIRKISLSGVVTTLPGAHAQINSPYGVDADSAGNVYVANAGGNNIIKITSAGVVTTLAGSGTASNANGTGTGASFNSPGGVAVDSTGNVYVGDTGNNLIRKITSAGVVTTLAGSGAAGSLNGTGLAASFNAPNGLVLDSSGNVYVAERGGNLIRKISPTGVVTTLAGTGTSGNANGTATVATFNFPTGVALDSNGNVYVADNANNLIRKITSAGVVTTLAGSATSGSANGTGGNASFSGPSGVAVDSKGNVYVSDLGNNLIRELMPVLGM